MCRLLAYVGSPVPLSRIMLDPEHSLEKQAWQPRELREAKLNADGFGIAWYNENRQQVFRYRETLPIWNDANLIDFASSLSQPLWLAYVRSATPGLGVSLHNTQPFIYQQWSFFHNGYILDFAGQKQQLMKQKLDDRYAQLVIGNTDSEYLFALLMQHLDTASPLEAIHQCFADINEICAGDRCLLNILFSDGTSIFATKHAINGLCPSLYYSDNNPGTGPGNQLIASEKFDNDENWRSLPDNSIIHITDNQPPVIIPL